MNSLLEAALERAQAGAYVLPLRWTDEAGVCSCKAGPSCKSPGKHPLTEHGLTDASRDPSTIEEWWQRWPDANVGVRADSEARLDVDALDVAETLAGDQALLRETEVVRTQSGGLHIVLACPDVPTSVIRLSDGRRLGELKGIGGYVVVPPSRVGSRAYVRLSQEGVSPLAVDDPIAWLGARLALCGHTLADTRGVPAYRNATAQVPEGGRHAALTSHAGALWVEGIAPAAFAAALHAVNETICAPPLPRDEVEAIAAHFVDRRTPRPTTGNGYHAAAEPPREQPPRPPACNIDEWLNGDDPPLQVVIGDGADGAILPLDGKGFVAGGTGIGKTNILLRMGRSLAEGSPFLSYYPVPTPRRVLHLALEGSRRGLRRRLRKVWADSDAEARARYFLTPLQLNLANADDLDALDTLIRSVRAEVVIIDPLRNAHTWDENSSQDVAQLTAILDGVIARHGCALIAAHHDRKRPPLTKKDGGTDRIRGSTALAGWLSFCLSIEKDKVPDTLTAEWTKVRDAEEALPDLTLTFSRERIDYAVEVRSAASKVSDDDVLTPVYHAGTDGIRGTVLVEAVKDTTGASERTVKARVRELVKDDVLLEFIADEDRRTKAKSYRLSQEEE